MNTKAYIVTGNGPGAPSDPGKRICEGYNGPATKEALADLRAGGGVSFIAHRAGRIVYVGRASGFKASELADWIGRGITVEFGEG